MQTVLDKICQISNTTISLIGLMILLVGGIITITQRLATMEASINTLNELIKANNAQQAGINKGMESRVYRLETIHFSK